VLNRIAVVIPAHNEQRLLPACLAALDKARAAIGSMPVEAIVVADDCDDATEAIAARQGCRVIAVSHHNVGGARAAGVDEALRFGPSGLWIATTDADSRVPPNWLEGQLAHAGRGADLVVGTVCVDDWSSWSPQVPPLYTRTYEAGVEPTSHRHVHGANLGFRSEAYLAAGGFRPLNVAEDWALVEAANAAGQRIVRPVDLPVLTSARPRSRVRNGFAGYLNALANRHDQLTPAPATS
jgi:glycosyltransferase involved in cell wall biosynthesis